MSNDGHATKHDDTAARGQRMNQSVGRGESFHLSASDVIWSEIHIHSARDWGKCGSQGSELSGMGISRCPGGRSAWRFAIIFRLAMSRE